MPNTLFAQLAQLAELCQRHPLLQRLVTLLAALVLGSMLILPGLVQPRPLAVALLQ